MDVAEKIEAAENASTLYSIGMLVTKFLNETPDVKDMFVTWALTHPDLTIEPKDGEPLEEIMIRDITSAQTNFHLMGEQMERTIARLRFVSGLYTLVSDFFEDDDDDKPEDDACESFPPGMSPN